MSKFSSNTHKDLSTMELVDCYKAEIKVRILSPFQKLLKQYYFDKEECARSLVYERVAVNQIYEALPIIFDKVLDYCFAANKADYYLMSAEI